MSRHRPLDAEVIAIQIATLGSVEWLIKDRRSVSEALREIGRVKAAREALLKQAESNGGKLPKA